MKDQDFSAWLATLPPDILGNELWLTGDPIVDALQKEVAESLANGGDGIPDSWKTEEAKWLDQKIQSKVASLSTPSRASRAWSSSTPPSTKRPGS